MLTAQPYLESLNPLMYQRAARFAWWAAWLIEKAASSDDGLTLDLRSAAHDAVEGALFELESAGIDRSEAADIERRWRFIVAAGRMPGPEDADLVAAFEAALIAGADEFATNLAKHGYGFVER
jgi:hypothetical protein